MPALRAGQRWQFTARLRPPHGNLNPHGFDIEAWLLERDIRATGYVREQQPALLITAMVWRPGYAVERLRERIRARLSSLLSGKAYAETVAWSKVLVDRATDLVVGAHIVGHHGEDLVHLFAMAMKHGIRATEIRSSVYGFPSFASDVKNMV